MGILHVAIYPAPKLADARTDSASSPVGRLLSSSTASDSIAAAATDQPRHFGLVVEPSVVKQRGGKGDSGGEGEGKGKGKARRW